jgi:hypothetical protein
MESLMALYAWKITAPGRPDHEQIGTLHDLEIYLNASKLSGASPSKPLIERARSMQFEGQGYYKAALHEEQRWSLLWIELGGA